MIKLKDKQKYGLLSRMVNPQRIIGFYSSAVRKQVAVDLSWIYVKSSALIKGLGESTVNDFFKFL